MISNFLLRELGLLKEKIGVKSALRALQVHSHPDSHPAFISDPNREECE